jgi:hypothetical protein
MYNSDFFKLQSFGKNVVLCELDVEDVIPHIPKMGTIPKSVMHSSKVKELRHIFKDRNGNEYDLKVGTETLMTVVSKPVCAHCGIAIDHFKVIQSSQGHQHLVPYAIAGRDTCQEGWHLLGVNLPAAEPGDEVKLTKDHIVPKSKGGNNRFRNYQTMCGPCNSKKGNGRLDSISNLWYIRWPNAVHPEGPFILPYATDDEKTVRAMIRERWRYKRLPKGFQCWPVNGHHIRL